MNIFKLIAALLFISSNLHSQNINIGGKVEDKNTALPIGNAKILIVNKSSPLERDSVLTNSAGEWSYIIQVTDVEDESIQPSSFSLFQNYPNPFNPSTKIAFSIKQPGNVKIYVHNILGEELNAREYFLNAGHYSIDWESTGSAGVLFYSVEINGARLTKKMVQLDGGKGGGLSNLTSRTISLPGNSYLPKKVIDDYYIIASKMYYDSDTLLIKAEDELSIYTKLETVHSKAYVIDLHNDVLGKTVNGYEIGEYHTFNQSDLPRFKQGGVDAQMLSLWVSPSQYPDNPYEETIRMIDTFMVQLERNSETFAQARNAGEAEALSAENKLAGILAVEGGHAIEDSIGKLIDLYERGARYMTITWNNSTSWATSASDVQSSTKGLSDFGREIIRLMDSLGIIIDISHTGIKTIEDILEVTKNPIIASHSGVRALRNHTRNLTDDQIKSIAAGGGVIGVVFYTSFLSSSPSSQVTIATVMQHINYIKDLVGVDYIGIGSDYDGGISAPVGLENVSKYPKLTEALLQSGYSNEDVKKIMGGNFMRVFRQVCK